MLLPAELTADVTQAHLQQKRKQTARVISTYLGEEKALSRLHPFSLSESFGVETGGGERLRQCGGGLLATAATFGEDRRISSQG